MCPWLVFLMLRSGRAQHRFAVDVAEQFHCLKGSIVAGNCLHVREFLKAKIHPAFIMPRCIAVYDALDAMLLAQLVKPCQHCILLSLTQYIVGFGHTDAKELVDGALHRGLSFVDNSKY